MDNTTATQIGAGNTVLFDGSRSYQYNADGEVVLSWQSSIGQAVPTSGDGQVMAYQWDARGRLQSVTIYTSGSNYLAGTISQTVKYTYDMFNNLIARTVGGDYTKLRLRRREPVSRSTAASN